MATSNAPLATNSKLKEFFVDQLKDIYWAEKKLTKALSKLQKAATTDQLKHAFTNHLEQTKNHVTRLENVFDIIGEDAKTHKCAAMAGIINESEEIIEQTAEGSAQRDVGLIFAAQKAEHYEIATYGGLATLADSLGYTEVKNILGETLSEEKQADLLLTEIAENNINDQARLESQE